MLLWPFLCIVFQSLSCTDEIAIDHKIPNGQMRKSLMRFSIALLFAKQNCHDFE